ncbi:MAG: SRPBCC family protein [Acidimicrobiales bacterium]
MSRIRVSTVIDAPPRRVWAAVRDIASHVTWMEDAVAIRYTSPKREGVGTTFDCDTRVGPFRLTDRMEVTEWCEGRAMGIRHVGLVQGTGRFTVRRSPLGRTRFTWDERLRFPWWMGGAPGSVVAAPVLRHIWRRNLVNLKREIEAPRRGRRRRR